MVTRAWPAIVIAVVGCQPEPEPAPVFHSSAAEAPDEVRPVHIHGLRHVFRVSDRLFSGSSPDGDAGYAALKRLGVKTIISVDGARPDADAARRHGLTYVHLPFGYDGIPRDRILGLVKAATDLRGPIYVHCHHGKHRGPAAVAVIQLCTDPTWDPPRAEAWLRTAGTDPRYTGLTAMPRWLVRPSQEELAGVPSSFPEYSAVTDLARLMVQVDSRWDQLKLSSAAGWAAPKDHPDIDPTHEAVQLIEHYRETARLEAVKLRDREFLGMLGEAEAAAAELELALRAKSVDADRADKAFARSAAACAACHGRFRDGGTANP